MDGLFNKGKELLNKAGSSSGGQAQGGNPNTQPAQGADGQEDYGDKGLDFIEKKTGHSFSREQNEKATDAARGFYEKETGKTVNPKYSN